MSIIALSFLLSTAFANWDATWEKSVEILWQGKRPEPTDAVGVSAFCGYARFSQRTEILLTIQNRGQSALCFEPKGLITPSKAEMRKIQNSLMVVGSRVARAVLHSHLSAKNLYQQGITLTYGCRILKSQNYQLPDFAGNDDHESCTQDRIRLEPGEIFEASYDLLVPFVDLVEFNLQTPTDCDGSQKTPEPYVLGCGARK